MKNYKVIDSFIFSDEIEMLKMRLDYLYDSVDYFVISESNKTFTGVFKELFFRKNISDFSDYLDKIHYVTYEPEIDEEVQSPWDFEKGQRNVLMNKIKELADDHTLILHGDLDEFPDKIKFDAAWERVKDMTLDMVSFSLRTFYYSPTTELEIPWNGTAGLNKTSLNNLLDLAQTRDYRYNSPYIEDGGWHLSFFTTLEKIQHKLKTYSHQEFNTPENTDIDSIKYRMFNGLDLFGRPEMNIKKHESIEGDFPTEFYRHDIFFLNTFERLWLKPNVYIRKKESMQIPLEIENLQLEVSRINPKIIVEIGTARGGTISRWLEIPSAEVVVSIDYPVGIHGGQGFEERTYVISDCIEQANLTNKKFYAINGDSKLDIIINRLEEILDGKKIDFLFIDGDHTYEGVSGDFSCYNRFLREGSLVGFHDITDSHFHQIHSCFVPRFWNEISKKYTAREYIFSQHFDPKILELFHSIGVTKNNCFGGIGVIDYSKKESPENITLLVPVFNQAAMTCEMISTTLSSSARIDEVIIYSNGSKEYENLILEDFSESNPLIKLVVEKRQIGFVKAVNEGFKLAKNDLVLCMNSDSCMYSNWEEILSPLISDKKNGVVGPGMVYDSILNTDEFVLGFCFIIRKSLMRKIGMLNEGFGLGYCDDCDLSYRVKKNGYNLGYVDSMDTSEGWVTGINFPTIHKQGESFMLLDPKERSTEYEWNKKKFEIFRKSEKVVVFRDISYEDLVKIEFGNLDQNFSYTAVIRSGMNFDKIRYDKDLVKHLNIFECLSDSDIDEMITSVSCGKQIIMWNDSNGETETKEEVKISWLAKFDDYSSMGILSQRILENLKTLSFECRTIIGESTTNNALIKNSFTDKRSGDLGIMFAYPDMVGELDSYRTKVIYTGLDSTLGIPNFSDNCNKSDFILTPSSISKERMIALGVKKPIFVFSHGIDPDKFKFTKKDFPNIFKFLYVGELSDRKGSFHLIKAFINCFGKSSAVELHIKSNTEMLFYGGDELQNTINNYPNIKWIKSDDANVEKLYSDCHAYVYPSRADSFGMTIIEAMACGLPVISTLDPGSTELIRGKFFEIKSSLVDVQNHPWMLGQWGEPDQKDLESKMRDVYFNYKKILDSGDLENNSQWVRENLNWAKLVEKFERDIIPKLSRKRKILTLCTSFNRPHHISNVIDSLKSIREISIQNDVYIVENSNPEIKSQSIEIIKSKADEGFTLYDSNFNLGQRGALLQMLEDHSLDDYDFVQFTDQDNQFLEPLSTYCNILDDFEDCFFVTGYMSKEHGEMGWRKSEYGNLCEKRSLRAGHMFMRAKDLKSLLPIYLDSQYNQPQNSSWNAGLDWELSWWNPNSPGKRSENPFVLCVPGGVLHKGIDSTMYEWDVNSCEYQIDELKNLRNSGEESAGNKEYILNEEPVGV